MCIGESIDIVDLDLIGNTVGRYGERELWQQLDRLQAAQLELDLEHSKFELGIMSSSGDAEPAQLPEYSSTEKV